jgi:hypothetical protein
MPGGACLSTFSAGMIQDRGIMIQPKYITTWTQLGWLILAISSATSNAEAKDSVPLNQAHAESRGFVNSIVDETDIGGFGAVDVTDFSVYFSGPASNYQLNLNGSGVSSGLYAIDPADTSGIDGDGIGQGDEVLLFQTANQVAGQAAGQVYFTIEADSFSGEVQFTLFETIWSADTANSDESMALNTPLADDLTLSADVARTAGGGFSEELNLGQGIFFINDDGPTVITNGSLATLPANEFNAIQLLVDESFGTQANPVDNVADRVSTTDFQAVLNDLFQVAFGADGPGVLNHTLVLHDEFGSPPFVGLPSGLYALDENSGSGQGEEILLFMNNGEIEGRANGNIYFSITSVGTEVTLTQSLNFNLWHPDSANDNDTVALTGLDGSGIPAYDIRLQRLVVDADGDSASASLSLTEANNSGHVLTFFDDSLSVNGPLSFGSLNQVEFDDIQLSVDESAGQQPDPEDTVADRVSAADYSDQYIATALNTSGMTAIDFGTDGPGAFIFSDTSLLLTDGSGAPLMTGTDSGVFGLVEQPPGSGVFQQSSEIQLSQVGNSIEGQADGVTFFTVSINGSQVTLTQTPGHNLWHPDDTNVDDVVSLTGRADGSATLSYQILLEAAVADRDGDAMPAALLLTEAIDVNGQTRYVLNFADSADDADDAVAPNAVDDVYTAFEDIVLTADDADGSVPGVNNDGVLVNDTDINRDVLAVNNSGTAAASGLGGQVNLAADGTFSYTPPADISGQATLQVEVTDGQAVVTSQLIIDVLPVNDAPGFSITGDVLDADFNPDFINNSLTILGFAFDISAGPADESGQSLQFFTTIISDDEAIIDNNGIILSNAGDLTIDFTGNTGSALIEVYLQDDGSTTNGGTDTSPVMTFEVSAFDLIYTNGFEAL